MAFAVAHGGGGFCRSPCGERGLKSTAPAVDDPPEGSLPVRGAWVEIYCSGGGRSAGGRRSPCGERGLKFDWEPSASPVNDRRSPCGERGLKLEHAVQIQKVVAVAPRAGSVG